ncbi:hypothetical protein V2J92_25750 [Pseudomonas alliivorans]|nr:hypothetical protein [Pseudomonas alliivorans]MEE5171543.1 hypothetical protein [Pseudomonas alliivorans]
MKWLVFTALFGLVPVFMRLLVASLVGGDNSIEAFATSDFISFGIVLQVSVFNEIRYHDLSDVEWKHRMMGVSSFFMLMYAALYVVLLFSEVLKGIQVDALFWVAVGGSFVSFLLCFVSYDRMAVASAFQEPRERLR